jgi:hypothetical protein
MLMWLDLYRAGGSFAEIEKAPDLVTKLRKSSVFGVLDVALVGHRIYRVTIYIIRRLRATCERLERDPLAVRAEPRRGQERSHDDPGVGQLEDGPVLEVNEVDDVPSAEAIDDVRGGPREDER